MGSPHNVVYHSSPAPQHALPGGLRVGQPSAGLLIQAPLLLLAAPSLAFLSCLLLSPLLVVKGCVARDFLLSQVSLTRVFVRPVGRKTLLDTEVALTSVNVSDDFVMPHRAQILGVFSIERVFFHGPGL